jgi:uncharacterized protein (TIGR02145 family)
MKTAKLFLSPLSRAKSRRDGTLLTVCFSLREILLSALLFFFCTDLHAQVTIGGIENPKAGAILDLNSTTKGGLILSNVTIADQELIPQNTNIFEGVGNTNLDVNEELRGIMVYNDGQDSTVPAGIYIWNGYCWTKDGGGTTAVTAPSISIGGTVTNTYSIVEGSSVTFAVVSPQAGVSYNWYKNNSHSNSGGTPVKTGLTCNTPPDLAVETHYYYCTATSDACPSSNAVSSPFTLTVNTLQSLPIGSGSLAGRACFDVMIGNNGAGCGTTTTRQSFLADFTQSATNTQEYIFSPLGTVSNLRFYAEEDGDHIGEIIESKSYDTDLETAHDISDPQTFTIVYKNNLNSEAANKNNSNALSVGIFAVYNDAPDGTGTNKTVKVTALIKDCQCCGAYLNAAQTQWLNFSCHNLGVDESVYPFTPDAALHGDRFKWGVKDPAMTQSEDQNSTYNNGVSDWLSRGGTSPVTSDVDWDMSEDYNPCPSGWRVPTKDEWTAVINYNSLTREGTWSTIIKNPLYSAGVNVGNALFLPATGHRSNDTADGALYSRGYNSNYWSSNADGSDNGYFIGTQYTGAIAFISSYFRFRGYDIRCVTK